MAGTLRINRLLAGLAAGLLLTAAAGGAWWLWRPAPPAPRPLMVVISGDTGGWIVPCGCTSNQSGGLPRRGTFVHSLRKTADLIIADAGGAPGGTSPYHRARFEAILQGELAMGLDAHNIGGPEAALGSDYLREVSTRLAVPFVSVNVRDSKGAFLTEPIRIIERGGRRIALTGVLAPQFARPGLVVDDPRDAIVRMIAVHRHRYDSLIVLAYLPETELRQLASQLPEADAVVGGPTGQAIIPQMAGTTVLAAATNKGKFLVQLDPSSAWTGQVVELDARFADDADQQANVRRYLGVLAAHDFLAADTGFAPALPAGLPADYRIAGNASCQSCHAADCKQWDGSKHAQAWQTLADRGYHVDSYCQQCHTTGFGLPGGFESARRSVVQGNVGCESCHGPSQAHVRDPKIRTPFAGRDQCSRCHDRENSPTFALEPYWQKIMHGKSP